MSQDGSEGSDFSDLEVTNTVKAEVLEPEGSSYWVGRPLTYFLFPALTWDELERFLHRHGASQACVDKAIVDLERYQIKMLSCEDLTVSATN